MRTALVLVAALLATAPSLAAEDGGCGAFKWPIEADRARLAAAAPVASGERVDASAPLAVRLATLDAATAKLVLPPERRRDEPGRAAALSFVAEGGTYQVTVTERVWIDAVQDGAYAEEAGFSGVKNCEGVRKSVRFRLRSGPVTLQVSGAAGETVGVAVSRLP